MESIEEKWCRVLQHDDQPTEPSLSATPYWLFDLDGVLTNSAVAHAHAWKVTFDEFLAGPDAAAAGVTDTSPFEIVDDYLQYVDGRRRADGIKTFLESRGVEMSGSDPRRDALVSRLGSRKNDVFRSEVEAGSVKVFPDAPPLLAWLADNGCRLAVVSSSANTSMVLERTGLGSVFEFAVDGALAKVEGIRSKPAPDMFLRAASEFSAAPADCVVIEDALVGVEAGRAGGFGRVIGVDRSERRQALLDAGADVVVAELTELITGRD